MESFILYAEYHVPTCTLMTEDKTVILFIRAFTITKKRQRQNYDLVCDNKHTG